MDKITEALSKFRKPYNCAQTVYAAFNPDDADDIANLSACGGGRAPEGRCGALYAATKLRPEAADAIRAEFAQATGSEFCREIKTVHKTPCEKCVSTACFLAENFKA